MLWSILIRNPLRLIHSNQYADLNAVEFITNTLWVTFLLFLRACVFGGLVHVAMHGSYEYVRAAAGLFAVGLGGMFLIYCGRTAWDD